MNEKHSAQKLTRGEFGRRSQLSRKALRLYEARGLLVPALIDPENGYRYYSRAQLARARLIRLLRLMEMPLDSLGEVLALYGSDWDGALRLIYRHVAAVEKKLAAAQLAARLVREEIIPPKENAMAFEFSFTEVPGGTMVSIRRQIKVPAYHEWLQTALRQLWEHIAASGGRPAGSPIALYYGPVNEEDDGPVEIGVPFAGAVPPRGEMKIREWPAHRAVCIRTFGEYNEYPRVLEMWHALGRYVDEQGLEPDWGEDLTTYEVWHEDMTMTICWPVEAFPAVAGGAAGSSAGQ